MNGDVRMKAFRQQGFVVANVVVVVAAFLLSIGGNVFCFVCLVLD